MQNFTTMELVNAVVFKVFMFLKTKKLLEKVYKVV